MTTVSKVYVVLRIWGCLDRICVRPIINTELDIIESMGGGYSAPHYNHLTTPQT